MKIRSDRHSLTVGGLGVAVFTCAVAAGSIGLRAVQPMPWSHPIMRSDSSTSFMSVFARAAADAARPPDTFRKQGFMPVVESGSIADASVLPAYSAPATGPADELVVRRRPPPPSPVQPSAQPEPIQPPPAQPEPVQPDPAQPPPQPTSPTQVSPALSGTEAQLKKQPPARGNDDDNDDVGDGAKVDADDDVKNKGDDKKGDDKKGDDKK